MNKITDDFINTYMLDDNNYRVDILQRNEGNYFHFEAWLYHKDYGIKTLMWGEDGLNLRDFVELVSEHAYEYIDEYKRSFEDRPLFEKC